jgi:hypothetical protein
MKSGQTVQHEELPTAVAELRGDLRDARFGHVLVFFHFILFLFRVPV